MARLRRSSSGRRSCTVPSSARSTVIGSTTVCDRVPFGPLTVTVRPSMATSTPDGTVIGSFPMRDMVSNPSPDVGEDFAAHAVLVRLPLGLKAVRRRDDRDAEAAEDPGQIGRLRVDPQAGLGDPAQARDAPLAVAAVLQLDHQDLADLGVLGAVRRDVALALQDLGDRDLQLRVRHRDLVVVGRVRVAQTCEHVRDRIGHRHGDVVFSPAAVPLAGPTAIRGDRVQLPAALADARQLAAVRHLAHADAAQPELAQHGAGTPALLAAGVAADGELRLPGRLDDERLLGHRSVLPEGEAEPTQQGPAFLVGGRRRDDGDVHAAWAVDGVRVDLVEHRLLGEAEGVVAPAVELGRRQAAEVADTGQGDGEQAVEELPHPVAAQGHLRADRHALTQLELRDGLGRPADLRLLPGDRGEVADRAVDQLRVAGGGADAHVDDDLHDPRGLHAVAVAELLLQAAADLVEVALLQPGPGPLRGGGGHQISFPERREIRTRLPSSVVFLPTRVGLPSESTTITFETWMAASWVTMPPDWAPRWVWLTRVCFLIRLTPSTSTRSRVG